MRLTELETKVLRDLVEGRDPWGGKLGGSRRVSQAIGRLKRKGALDADRWHDVPTEAGRAALAAGSGEGGGT